MANGVTIHLPGWSRSVKWLILGHTAGYVAWLIFGRGAALTEAARGWILVPEEVLEGQAWQLLSYLTLFANPVSFLLDMIALWLIGSPLDQRWGSRRFLVYYAGCGVAGAAIVTLLSLLIEPLARAVYVGPDAAILAVLVAWGIVFAEAPLAFPGSLRVKGKHLLWLMLGLALFGLVTSPLGFALHGAAVFVGAIWTLGWWRPGRIRGCLRSLWLRWRARRIRRHLRAVGDENDRRYFH